MFISGNQNLGIRWMHIGKITWRFLLNAHIVRFNGCNKYNQISLDYIEFSSLHMMLSPEISEGGCVDILCRAKGRCMVVKGDGS